MRHDRLAQVWRNKPSPHWDEWGAGLSQVSRSYYIDCIVKPADAVHFNTLIPCVDVVRFWLLPHSWNHSEARCRKWNKLRQYLFGWDESKALAVAFSRVMQFFHQVRGRWSRESQSSNPFESNWGDSPTKIFIPLRLSDGVSLIHVLSWHGNICGLLSKLFQNFSMQACSNRILFVF